MNSPFSHPAQQFIHKWLDCLFRDDYAYIYRVLQPQPHEEFDMLVVDANTVRDNPEKEALLFSDEQLQEALARAYREGRTFKIKFNELINSSGKWVDMLFEQPLMEQEWRFFLKSLFIKNNIYDLTQHFGKHPDLLPCFVHNIMHDNERFNNPNEKLGSAIFGYGVLKQFLRDTAEHYQACHEPQELVWAMKEILVFYQQYIIELAPGIQEGIFNIIKEHLPPSQWYGFLNILPVFTDNILHPQDGPMIEDCVQHVSKRTVNFAQITAKWSSISIVKDAQTMIGNICEVVSQMKPFHMEQMSMSYSEGEKHCCLYITSMDSTPVPSAKVDQLLRESFQWWHHRTMQQSVAPPQWDDLRKAVGKIALDIGMEKKEPSSPRRKI